MFGISAETVAIAKDVEFVLTDKGYFPVRTGKYVEVMNSKNVPAVYALLKEVGFKVRKLKVEDGSYILIVK